MKARNTFLAREVAKGLVSLPTFLPQSHEFLQESVGPEGNGAAGGAAQACRERPIERASPEGDQVEAGSEADPAESEGGVGAHQADHDQGSEQQRACGGRQQQPPQLPRPDLEDSAGREGQEPGQEVGLVHVRRKARNRHEVGEIREPRVGDEPSHPPVRPLAEAAGATIRVHERARGADPAGRGPTLLQGQGQLDPATVHPPLVQDRGDIRGDLRAHRTRTRLPAGEAAPSAAPARGEERDEGEGQGLREVGALPIRDIIRPFERFERGGGGDL